MNSIRKKQNKTGNTTAWLASRSVRFQFQLCASTLKEFWHKMILCGPANTSTLSLIQSFSLPFTAFLSSFIHSIPRFLSIRSPYVCLTVLFLLLHCLHQIHSSVSYSLVCASISFLSLLPSVLSFVSHPKCHSTNTVF